ELFATNCGNCHTLAAAGTQGNFGPNLDDLLAPQGQATSPEAAKGIEAVVLNALRNGVDNADTPGRMPAGMLEGEQAKAVAEFVGLEAGGWPNPEPPGDRADAGNCAFPRFFYKATY